jgi:hypothetical protein
VVIKLYTLGERTLTITHLLKLYAGENTITIDKKIIACEQYDEIVNLIPILFY